MRVNGLLPTGARRRGEINGKRRAALYHRLSVLITLKRRHARLSLLPVLTRTDDSLREETLSTRLYLFSLCTIRRNKAKRILTRAQRSIHVPPYTSHSNGPFVPTFFPGGRSSRVSLDSSPAALLSPSIDSRLQLYIRSTPSPVSTSSHFHRRRTP